MNTNPYPEGGQGPAHNQPPAVTNSLLVADCGTVFTKVSLFGLVEGQYRLMARGEAPTTTTPPQNDITLGVIQALNTIEFITGRRFIQNGRILTPEQSNGDGVDAFISTVSAGGPLRLVVLGAVDTTAENLVAQAISGLYAEMHSIPSPSFQAAMAKAPLSVGAPGSEQPWNQDRIAKEWERQLASMREFQPQGALIVGMADGPAGPSPLQEACQLLVNATKQSSKPGPPTLYAGAPQYTDAVKRMVGGISEMTRLEPLTSQTQLGQVSMAVGSLHERNVIQKLTGYQRLQEWSGSAPVATATSLSSLVRFLAQHYAMNVAAVDVGALTTTAMLAGEQGEFIPVVNSGIGIGPGLSAVLRQTGWQRIARWLPFVVTEDEIREFTVNQMTKPASIPTGSRELAFCQAFAREALILTMDEVQKANSENLNPDLILATGGLLAHTPKYGQVAMMLLDAIQPRGITSLVLDRTMLISQLGAVATIAPIVAVQVNENDAVSHRLGTCVIPYGDLKPGELAVRVGVEYSNGRQINVDVMAGSIEVVPLKVNEQALLTLFPAPTVDVGLGPGERARAAEEIDGGLVGLIIDARGRPLALPSEEVERHARLTQWAQALNV
ncbi:glutamate mutase L [Ktedonospora formicarum]|uniref:Methylaspartate mutase n=1 Tax=Ktedonospora formicarum TaxID=2778364 RepID=A0A8J3MQ53_9CHLR|nr:glutamate mutase L [Ktedonospora formicarum]GHO43615.1 hypothetical protein KSX_17780 [Ktedonospora formicarum]